MENYILEKYIEKGSYGSVYTAKRKEGNSLEKEQKEEKEERRELVAIKRVPNKKKHYPDNELLIHIGLDHPNIIKMYESFYDYKYTYYVMEYADSGDLYTFLDKQPKKRLNEETALPIFLQISEALLYCHEHMIIHRDLKTENVLLCSHSFKEEQGKQTWNVKLTDFGLSTQVNEDNPYAKGLLGTIFCVSPEMIMGKYSFETDIWSLGVLFYMVLTGDYPFFHEDENKNTNEDILYSLILDVHYYFPSCVSSFSQRLISKILTRSVSQRAPLLQIIAYINLIMNAE